MKRPSRFLVLFATALACLACSCSNLAAGTEKRPNILLIVTDDQRADTLANMPKLNGLLAARGTIFANAIITTPVCCPSRASILTGQYAHNHGVRLNFKEYAAIFQKRDGDTLATWLKAGGYRTGLIGKYLNGYQFDYIPPGWDTFQAFAKRHYYNYRLTNFVNGVHGEPLHFGQTEQDYSTDVLTGKALKFIRSGQGADRQPFFLMLALNAPHRPAIPAPRHANSYEGLPLHRPPSFNRSSHGFFDLKWWAKGARPLSSRRIAKIDVIRKRMLQSLLAVDEAVEQIVDALAAENQLENTVIIYLGGDNGFHWGEHRVTDKRSPYEESIRAGLVIFDGRNPVGRESDALVANIDLAPTILELAGLPPQPTIDGVSLVPLLKGGDFRLWDHLLVQNFNESFFSVSSPFVAVRGRDAVYVKRGGWIWNVEEFYDLRKDPHQLDNAISNPEAQRRIAEMRAALTRLRSCSGPSCNGAAQDSATQ